MALALVAAFCFPAIASAVEYQWVKSGENFVLQEVGGKKLGEYTPAEEESMGRTLDQTEYDSRLTSQSHGELTTGLTSAEEATGNQVYSDLGGGEAFTSDTERIAGDELWTQLQADWGFDGAAAATSALSGDAVAGGVGLVAGGTVVAGTASVLGGGVLLYEGAAAVFGWPTITSTLFGFEIASEATSPTVTEHNEWYWSKEKLTLEGAPTGKVEMIGRRGIGKTSKCSELHSKQGGFGIPNTTEKCVELFGSRLKETQITEVGKGLIGGSTTEELGIGLWEADEPAVGACTGASFCQQPGCPEVVSPLFQCSAEPAIRYSYRLYGNITQHPGVFLSLSRQGPKKCEETWGSGRTGYLVHETKEPTNCKVTGAENVKTHLPTKRTVEELNKIVHVTVQTQHEKEKRTGEKQKGSEVPAPDVVTPEIPAVETNELEPHYQNRLETRGFTKVETKALTVTESEADGKPAEAVATVTPSPGTKADPSKTSVKVEYNSPDTPEPSAGLTPPTVPEIKLPKLGAVCKNFPFGAPCWLWKTLEGWSVEKTVPVFKTSVQHFSFMGHAAEIPEVSISLEKLEPIMVIVRPVMVAAATIGLVLLFYRFAMGGGAPSGSLGDSEGGESEND